MTHGVVVWLCPRHREPAFITAEGGYRFAERLVKSWMAAGALGARRAAALRSHIAAAGERIRRGPSPGSYSWPKLRREAERRFARGDDPRRVIGDLRERHQGDTAIVPSIRTMQRWFSQRRWLLRLTPPPDPRQPHTRAETLRDEWTRFVYDLTYTLAPGVPRSVYSLLGRWAPKRPL